MAKISVECTANEVRDILLDRIRKDFNISRGVELKIKWKENGDIVVESCDAELTSKPIFNIDDGDDN